MQISCRLNIHIFYNCVYCTIIILVKKIDNFIVTSNIIGIYQYNYSIYSRGHTQGSTGGAMPPYFSKFTYFYRL